MQKSQPSKSQAVVVSPKLSLLESKPLRNAPRRLRTARRSQAQRQGALPTPPAALSRNSFRARGPVEETRPPDGSNYRRPCRVLSLFLIFLHPFLTRRRVVVGVRCRENKPLYRGAYPPSICGLHEYLYWHIPCGIEHLGGYSRGTQ